jgi:Ca-activated chloride channel family protein
MRLTDEEIKNKFSALDFDKQNIKQNRIYSKLAFNQEERRYGMKKLILTLGTVCCVVVLFTTGINWFFPDLFNLPADKEIYFRRHPEKRPSNINKREETTKQEVKKPVFVKEGNKEESELALEAKAPEEGRDPFAAPYKITAQKQEKIKRAEEERKSMLSQELREEISRHPARSYGHFNGATADGAYTSNFSVKAGSAGASFGRGSMGGSGVWGGYYSYPSADYDSMNAESYKSFEGNAFKFVKEEPLSTFSADVDTASYNIVRRDIEKGRLPNKDAVRTEEFINYFTYDYAAPKASSKDPVNIITELTDSPWTEDFQVVKIGVKAKDIDKDKLPASNLVFLVDVSGSMSGNTRLPLVKKSFAMLVEKLRPQDKVSIVTYANGTNTVLDGVSLGDEDGKQRIISAMESLRASGGTNGSAGLEMAYQVAKSHFIKGGNNRIILATDGDFNIGNTSLGGLEKQITDAKESGVFLSVLGFGMGNYKDDRVQTLANKGNGNYAYINDLFEAKKALVKDFGATLFTVAKDVKFQVEFNPAKVQAYRLIGYEKRKLNDRDFNDDTKDAGEMGAGHTVTVLYEIVPTGAKLPEGMADIDELKYSVKATPQAVESDELLTVKLRYKEPDGDTSKLLSKVLKEKDYVAFDKTSDDTRFALSAAAFAEILKGSRYAKNTDIEKVLAEARKAKGEDDDGYRADFVKIVSLYEALPKETTAVTSNKNIPVVVYDQCQENRRKIRIDGILDNEAIVNGEIVTVGKKVFGAQVVEISDHSVWFNCNGIRFEQKMPLL